MRTTYGPLGSTRQVQNSNIVHKSVRDHANEPNTKVGSASSTPYLAFIALKDITDGYGEGKPGHDRPRPERERDPDPCRRGDCLYAIPDRPKPRRDTPAYAVPKPERFIPDYAIPEPRQRPEKW